MQLSEGRRKAGEGSTGSWQGAHGRAGPGGKGKGPEQDAGLRAVGWDSRGLGSNPQNERFCSEMTTRG